MSNGEGRYIYGIIGTSQRREFGPIGIGERGNVVYTLPYQNLAAIVSRSPLVKYPVTRDNSMAHIKVLERAMEEYTVLPVRFCTIAEEEEIIIEKVLKTRYQEFIDLLRGMEGKLELGVRARWTDLNAIFAEVVEENKETKEIFHLDIPGLDEVMSLKKIIDFMESSDYQLYIVDTAPTGHTLRLLMVPELLDNWIKLLANLRWKHHAMVRQFAREKRIERADTFLLEMKKTVKKVRALLQNAEKTEFVVVTIAEKMAVSETEDLIRNLEQMRIPSRHLIINNIFPQEESGFAEMRRKTQARYIHEMKEKFSAHSITEVALQPTEMQGIDRLQKLGAQLFCHRSLL